MLSFRPVPESELSAQPKSTSRFCSKTQPPQRKKQKKRPHRTAVDTSQKSTESAIEHRQVVKCVARNPCMVATTNQNPDGVTDSVVPSALKYFWHRLQGFHFIPPLPVICQAFGLFFITTTPSYGHPSFFLRCRYESGRAERPKEGTTLDAFFRFLPDEEVISKK